MKLRPRKKSRFNLGSDEIIKHFKDRKYFKWRSKSGKYMYLFEMDTNHIKNCCNKLRNGDYCMSNASHVLTMFNTELIYRNLVKEAIKK